MAQPTNYMNEAPMYPSPSSPITPATPKDLDFLFATVNSNGNITVGQNGYTNNNTNPNNPPRVNSPLMQAPQSQPQNSPSLAPQPYFAHPNTSYYNFSPKPSNNNNNNNTNNNPIEFFETNPSPPSSAASNRSPVIDLDFNPNPHPSSSPQAIQTPPTQHVQGTNAIPLNSNLNNSNNNNGNLNTPSSNTATAPELNVQVLQIGRIIQMLEILTSTSSQVLSRVEGMEGRLGSLETSVKEILTNQRSLNMQFKDTEKKQTVQNGNMTTTSNNNNNNNLNTSTTSPISTPPQIVQPTPTPGPYQMGYFPPMMGMPHPMMPMSGQLVPVTHIKEPGVITVTPGGDNYNSDLELAKKLQASFDSEAPQQPQSQPQQQQLSKPVARATPRDLQECPMCALKLPIGELESHVAGHFEEDIPEKPKKEEPKPQPGFFSKLFSKTEDEKNKQSTATSTPSSNTSTPTPNTSSNPPSLSSSSSLPTNNSTVNRPASTSVGSSSSNSNTYNRPPPNVANTPNYPGSFPRNQYYYQPAPMQQYLYPNPYSPMGDQSQHQ